MIMLHFSVPLAADIDSQANRDPYYSGFVTVTGDSNAVVTGWRRTKITTAMGPS